MYQALPPPTEGPGHEATSDSASTPDLGLSASALSSDSPLGLGSYAGCEANVHGASPQAGSSIKVIADW